MRRRARDSSLSRSESPSSGLTPRVNKVLSPPARESEQSRADVPASWLSCLLEISCRLPIESGPDAVAAAVIEAAASVLPNHALGAVLRDLGIPADRRVICPSKRGPENGKQAAHRLFVELAYERTFELRGEHELVELHVACDDADAIDEGSHVEAFMRSVGDVLLSALRTTRHVSAKGRESMELRGQIIQTEKLASLGQIAAGVVHELNNPLTSIVGYSDYLRTKAERQKADPADIERLRRISEAAGRILRFSRDLVAYARPSIEPPSPVSIDSVIDQAVVFCEHVLKEASIGVERTFAREVRPVFGVRDQLIQVFVNLFTNACHAMESKGGTLSIETKLAASRNAVEIVVSDTGHGIDAETVKRIFDPFFTTKTDGRGTGLGLSIVRNIVLLHRGSIDVESSPDRGTVFTLELPIAP